jgi:hypothetical protein
MRIMYNKFFEISYVFFQSYKLLLSVYLLSSVFNTKNAKYMKLISIYLIFWQNLFNTNFKLSKKQKAQITSRKNATIKLSRTRFLLNQP